MTRSLVCNLFRVSILFVFSVAAANAQVTQTISINFAADEPPGIGSEIESGEPAGVLGTTEWNNLSLNFGTQENLIDSDGNVTEASILWESNNTWASAPVNGEGRSENNIDDSVPVNGDRLLMTGYLDSNAVDRFCTDDESQFIGNWCGANRVTVAGLPDYESYSIIVYFNGGVLDRGGFVKLNDLDPVVQHDTAPFNGVYDLSFEERDINGELLTVYTGDVMIFSDVQGDSFTINTHPFNLGNGTFRTFINGIEISGDLVTTGPDCDFDDSGVCDIVDINELMYTGLAGGDPATYDLNQDGVVDLGDRDAWLVAAGSLPGDANLDGVNNAQDLNAVGSNWQAIEITSWASLL